MKKLIATILAVLMLLSLAACGGAKEDPKDTPSANAPTDAPADTPDAPADTPDAPADAPTEPEADLPNFTFTKFGNAKITVLGAELKEDAYGDPFLRVYYEYLNMDETAAGHAPYLALELEITQGEEELYSYEFTADDEEHVPEDLFYNCAVQPGIPVRNTINVYCDPEGGPVDFACHVMVGSWAYNEEDVEWLEFQIDPKNPMPAPEEPFEIQPIANPTYAKDLPTSGTSTSMSNPFTISLDGYELTTYDGQPALRVKMTYTHQHEWEMSPYTALTINAFQDGIALVQGDTWYLDEVTPEDEAFETDVATGETVTCNAIFILRGDSPVEVVVEQPLDDTRVGLICNIQ